MDTKNGPSQCKKTRSAIRGLHQVIKAGRGHTDVVKAKLELIRYANEHRLEELGRTAWEIIVRLLSARSAKRQKFWCQVFQDVFDDAEELISIAEKLVRSKFDCAIRQLRADEARDAFEQGALALMMPEYRKWAKKHLAEKAASEQLMHEAMAA